MKKSIWIFLLAVLAPGIVLGWLALRSAEEQQIVFERRTAELYQKEADNLAGEVRKLVESERRSFGDVVHRLLANGDAHALAKDFTFTLADAWPRRAVGFALASDGQMLSPSATVAAGNATWRDFLWNNGAFLSGAKPAVVYAVPHGSPALNDGYANVQRGRNAAPQSEGKPALRLMATQNEEAGGGKKMLALKHASAPMKADADSIRSEDATPMPARAPEAAAKANEGAKPVGRDASDVVAKPASEMRGNAAAPAPQSTVPQSRAKTVAPPPSAPAAMTSKELDLPREASDGQALSKQRLSPEAVPQAEAIGGFGASQRVQTETSPFTKSATLNRMVEPQQQISSPTANWSAVVPATADFSSLTGWSDEGMVSRFVQDKLELIFWIRPPEAPDMVFGCLVEAADLQDLWESLFGITSAGRGENGEIPFVMSLLDDKARPVATRPAKESGRDWTRPFVASEIGEVLPHWEAALYLATPTAIIDSARGFRRTLSFTIVGALALIALGGWLVVADVRRQLALAQQKTDFVSNVSHELKTPLTSIRMFAELLHDRPPPKEKQGQYLRIITVEAERLTRLINNVLDFAKLERKQRHFEKRPVDFHEVIERVWEGHEIHLQDAGFVTKWEAAPGPYPVIGDEDALAQILVNLLSNAEKYSVETKEVELATWVDGGFLNMSVMDRGLGVPEGEEKKIFEAFYRAHDSLSSGIQGSGLGLTLACRLAAEHGGSVRYERRKDGGSRFTLRVPLALKKETTDNV